MTGGVEATCPPTAGGSRADLTVHERGLLDLLPCGVAQLASDGSVLWMNEEASRIAERPFGALRAMMCGGDLPPLLKEDGSPCPVDEHPAVRCLRSGEAQGPKITGSCSTDGEEYWTVTSAAPAPGGGAFLVLHDVSERQRAEREARAEGTLLQQALGDSLVGVVRLTPDYRFASVNRSFCDFLGYEPDELSRLSIREVTPELESDEALAAWTAPSALDHEQRFVRKDGAVVWGHVVASPNWVCERGSCRSYRFAVVRDVTRRRRAESTVAAFVERSNDGIVFTNAEGVVEEANERIASILGHAREELLGIPYRDLTRSGCTATARGPIEIEDELRRKDGTLVPVHVNMFVVDSIGGIPLRSAAVIRDITERKAAELRTREAKRRLRSLASELTLAEEREQRRIAEQLHDRVGQNLAVVAMRIGALRKRLSGADQLALLDEARQLCEDAIRATRTLTAELSPPILSELGLVAALEWLVDREDGLHAHRILFESDGGPKQVPRETSVLLFRAVQELLANVAKHARASQVLVRVARGEGDLTISVVDDGVGFDTAGVEAHDAFGLYSIRERLASVGGRLEMSSQPGRGTTATLHVPTDVTTSAAAEEVKP